jgi:N-acetylneuraminic acid mutarotase
MIRSQLFFVARILILNLLCIIIVSGCKKQEHIISPAADKPSSLSVLSVQQKDLNKFMVSFEIKSDSAFMFDNYGLMVAKDTNVEKGRIYSFGSLGNIKDKRDSCLLDSLEGNTTYHFRIFVKKGNAIYLSTDKYFTVGGLKITSIRNPGISAEPPYASRNETLEIYTNIQDITQQIKETKVKIGGIEALVMSDYGNTLIVVVPDSLTAGKKAIEIERNGLKLTTSDTLNILIGKYTFLNDFPFTYRSHFGYVQIGDVGYMIGGANYALSMPDGLYNDILAYNINTDQWSATNYSHYPKEYIFRGECFAVNGKIYCFSGHDTITNSTQFESTGRFFVFDRDLNTWTEKSPFPGQKRFDPGSFVANGKIYIFGGNSNGALSDLWEYDPATDSWTRKADFPGTPVYYAATFYYNNIFFVEGGGSGQFASNEFWEYDLQRDTWRQLPTDDRIHERFRSVYFTIGNKGYMLGGTYVAFDAFGATEFELADSWELNLETKQWSRISNFNPIPLPPGFTSFYAKPAVFLRDNNAIIYDRGKMIQFLPE